MTISNRNARRALVAIVVALSAACSSNGSPTPTIATATGGTLVDVHGQFSGTYRFVKCVDEGGFAGACAQGFAPDDMLPISLSLTQTQSTVKGNVDLGAVSGTFQGTVTGSTLTGAATMTDVTDQGQTLSTSITDWNTTLAGNALSGGFTVGFRVSGVTGSVKLSATIVQLTR